jgi:hypothetical protein
MSQVFVFQVVAFEDFLQKNFVRVSCFRIPAKCALQRNVFDSEHIGTAVINYTFILETSRFNLGLLTDYCGLKISDCPG